jgi:hypothetical protein
MSGEASGAWRDVIAAERARLARDTHDVLGQILTALRMELRLFGSRARSHRTEVARLVDLVDQALDAVQHFALDLRYPIPDDVPLTVAVAREGRDWAARSGVALECSVPTQLPPLSRDQVMVVLRVLREALNNVARHARATRTWVTLEQAGGTVRLTVRDDGVGAPVSALANPRSLGVLGMRELAASLGGTLECAAAEEGGIRVRLTLPGEEER